jgi:transcription antitermination factor NusA-like protein
MSQVVNQVGRELIQYAKTLAVEKKISLEDIIDVLKISIIEILQNKSKSDVFTIDLDVKGSLSIKKRPKTQEEKDKEESDKKILEENNESEESSIVAEKPVEAKDLFNLLNIKNISFEEKNIENEEDFDLSVEVDINKVFSRNDIFILEKSIKQGFEEKKREREFQSFEPRVNTIAQGSIKHIKSDRTIILDIDGTEALMYSNKILISDLIARVTKIFVYIYQVKSTKFGPQVFVSRTSKDLVRCLAESEIPDFDKKIIINGVARIPGVKTKIAVSSRDPFLDAAAYCIGTGGSIAAAIAKKLDSLRERVFFVNWTDNQIEFLSKCLFPAQIVDSYTEKVKDEEQVETEILYIVVADHEFEEKRDGSLGLKSRTKIDSQLAGGILNKKIFLISESDYCNIKESKLFFLKKEDFMEYLSVNEEVATILEDCNFTSINDLKNITPDELIDKVNMEEFDIKLGEEIIQRATKYIEDNPIVDISKDIEDNPIVDISLTTNNEKETSDESGNK